MNQNLQKLSFFKSLGFVENTSLFIESNFDKLGNFYKLNLPGHTIYVVIDPEVLQHVLIRNEENIFVSNENQISKYNQKEKKYSLKRNLLL